MTDPASPLARVRAYHERTKHRYERYALGPGYLDWASQPDPFRTWAGAPRLELPLAADSLAAPYDELFAPRTVAPAPLGLESLAAFCELALGLTAWKEFGDSRWALRANPSSGNLHPTEGYLVLPAGVLPAGVLPAGVLPAGAGPTAGVHHYASRDHALEQRCELGPPPDGSSPGPLPGMPPGAFLVGLSSIHWREAWKYGERAFRYCQHDAGHALACARFAAAALGWSARLLDGFGDERVARLLGLARSADFAGVDELEREHPDAVVLVCRERGAEADLAAARAELAADELVALAARGLWRGRASELSSEQRAWVAIEDAASATWKPPSLEWSSAARAAALSAPPSPPPPGGPSEPLGIRCELPAAALIRQRRSAVALDGRTGLARADFYGLLERLVPGAGRAPWDALPWAPRVHLALFVHRVDELAPGLYLLERTAAVHAELERELGPKALWTRPPGCPPALRLFCIGEADVRRAATSVSCGQEIAGDGAFSLGMLAEYRDALSAGAWNYRRLFWETGVIGQVLYLEAEARGVRGTGIGCFFDDPVHQVVGLESDRFQSLYHFTLGGPVEDERLVTRPAYAHLGPPRRRLEGG